MDVKNIENCTPVMTHTTLQINIDRHGVFPSFKFTVVVEELENIQILELRKKIPINIAKIFQYDSMQRLRSIFCIQ